ncbi:CoA transferase [Delftia tsuruhatensis]|uniref:CaiB/BaiF CoA transferase family protein n=1 Tax=Delftia tsuruhatensis TaxID=180282 RepID=UPI003D1CEE6D
MSDIFSHIKVLDLSRAIAGPIAAQALADMGATVYKVERPGQGDELRQLGPYVASPYPDAAGTRESAAFHAYNRGKKSITLDIASDRGADIVRRLTQRCDVLIENYKAGTLDRYGLGAERLRAENPRLVYCSVTGFGQDGPYANRPAYDFIAQGLSGLMSTCGEMDGEPMRTSVPMIDLITGHQAALSIVSALYHRERTGRGQYVEATLLDSAVAFNGHLAQGYLMGGPVPQRAGNTNPIAAPSTVLRCRDGAVILAAGNNHQFQAMCEALGWPGLAQEPRFASNASRVANAPALYAELTQALRPLTRAEVVERLSKAKVPGGPINDLADVFADPQVAHRGLVQKVELPGGASYPVVRSPLRFSETPVRHRPSPRLGEHTDEVLREELGLDDAVLGELREQAVL